MLTKQLSLFVATAFLAALPLTQAGAAPLDGHKINIHNGHSEAVYYSMMSKNGGLQYGLKANESAHYTTKLGDDEGVNIYTGTCSKILVNQFCKDPGPATDCAGGSIYLADKISAIEISSPTTCTVTCVEGDSNSCKKA